ncbi:MAG: short chain dehydrogenase [Deltaproteobacteria bacterium HGW-Deltaproteobacteria-17]|nr:MAG: short chain dehydrogenase [Deltaproteobacteria bacterium HGW-Deltaproteobacteria-17]
MSKKDKKRAVITGAGSGLGRELALALAAEGWMLGLADLREEAAAETLAMVQRNGGHGDTFRLDVREPDQVAAMASYFWSEWGGVDLLINNAGVAAAGPVGDMPLDEWKRVVDTNFWGMVYGCHSFIPKMCEQGGGYIVNVSSAAGFASLMHMAAYNTSKAAVISLSETLSNEVSPHKIGVTVVCPSFFDTHLLDGATFCEGWEDEFAHACFAHAKMDAAEIARRTVKAIKRRRLYLVPQPSAKLVWMMKRMTPGIFYGNLAFYNKAGLARPLVLWMAKHGLI